MKNRAFVFVFIFALTLINISCAPERAIHEDVIDKGPSVTVRPLPMADRITVAIARFSNETHYGSGLFRDEYGDRIGKQASDSLARQLLATQRFIVVERQDIDRLQAEAELMGEEIDQFRSQLKGVDALILGSVVELGRETTGKSWMVGASKTQRARARVVLRMVDPHSGEVFYATDGSGDATLTSKNTLGFGGQAGFDSTLEGKAIEAAIVNMMNNVTATLETHGRASQTR
ncbi:MAG: curli production assembly protein CsgG [Deltaproteobacteria bacterium]|nr:curli production assembly protein CsgG [Deltaproteobacteria bacterium]